MSKFEVYSSKENSNHETPLHYAVMNQNKLIVDLLLSKDAIETVSSKGEIPSMIASQLGKPELIHYTGSFHFIHCSLKSLAFANSLRHQG
jgi:ankyrin repeat protein